MSSTAFLEKLSNLSRDELLEIIDIQNPQISQQIKRIEWVFENKLRHLTWSDGTTITSRPVTNEELALLIDEPFMPDKELSSLGLTIEDQRQLHVAKDPVLWSKYYLDVSPRAYQIMMLRHPNRRKVLRAGRRLGKTWTMSVLLLHYSFTHKNGRCIVVAPMKSQVELIYTEMMTMAKGSDTVLKSITRNVTSPQFTIEFSNGSTIRFFTSGIRSGGKADVVRGQEAHIIVLDELDYMHGDDLESLYAMLQKTDEGQEDKLLIGASTPTGRREHFWKWCNSKRFTEFWFPSYVNPNFEKENEEEYREQYSEMGYRHEIEADWGEDTEGVYPRRYVDLAFSSGRAQASEYDDPETVRKYSRWEYIPEPTSSKSFFTIGVDWDKYGAGTNIVVLEICDQDHEDERAAGRVKLSHREEIKKDEYTLTKAVDRLIQLNEIFRPRHIFVDRGYGEVQVELLHKYGVENPSSNLRKVVEGVSFSETIEVRDPATKQLVKKELKPFMVDNLRQMLEKQNIIFSEDDDELYLQLISYVVVRLTQTGRPVFEAAGKAGDHAHDALILAAYSIYKNYGDLMRYKFATKAVSVSNAAFSSLMDLSSNPEIREKEMEVIEKVYGSSSSAPIVSKRGFTVNMNNRSPRRPIKRKMF